VARHSKVVNWAPRGHRVSGQLADYSVTDPCWPSSVFPAFQVTQSRARERVGVDSRAAIDASSPRADPSRGRGIRISLIRAGSDVPPSTANCRDVALCTPLSAPMGYDRACSGHVVLFVVSGLDPTMIKFVFDYLHFYTITNYHYLSLSIPSSSMCSTLSLVLCSCVVVRV